jgi:5-methylcytosine-specific restriction endonuclease McrA
VPIFASVKPQTSCRYIVPIRTVAGGAQNWVDEKDWILCEKIPVAGEETTEVTVVHLAEAEV